jgi:ribonuclease HII
MQSDLWAFEEKVKAEGFLSIAGIDEAGRGPLAGPVVSAAVILPDDFSVSGVTDFQKLTLESAAAVCCDLSACNRHWYRYRRFVRNRFGSISCKRAAVHAYFC